MIELIYQSISTKDLNSTELCHLLRAYRVANELHGITGLLLYHDRTFIQLIEGAEHDVETLFNNIGRDPINTKIRLAWKGSIKERAFSEWSMAFIDMNSQEQRINGYSNYLMDGILSGDVTSVITTSKSLLKSMAQEFMLDSH